MKRLHGVNGWTLDVSIVRSAGGSNMILHRYPNSKQHGSLSGTAFAATTAVGVELSSRMFGPHFLLSS